MATGWTGRAKAWTATTKKADINPAATEVCADSADNNCDGQIDEGCGG